MSGIEFVLFGTMILQLSSVARCSFVFSPIVYLGPCLSMVGEYDWGPGVYWLCNLSSDRSFLNVYAGELGSVALGLT